MSCPKIGPQEAHTRIGLTLAENIQSQMSQIFERLHENENIPDQGQLAVAFPFLDPYSGQVHLFEVVRDLET